MNRPITAFTRMIDQYGRPLTWRGKWVPLWNFITVPEEPRTPVAFPVKYPHSYYKVDR